MRRWKLLTFEQKTLHTGDTESLDQCGQYHHCHEEIKKNEDVFKNIFWGVQKKIVGRSKIKIYLFLHYSQINFFGGGLIFNFYFAVKRKIQKGWWPMRGQELIMWSQGQWAASKKTATDGADRQTDKQIHGHGNSMTNLAQWGRVGENVYQKDLDMLGV